MPSTAVNPRPQSAASVLDKNRNKKPRFASTIEHADRSQLFAAIEVSKVRTEIYRQP